MFVVLVDFVIKKGCEEQFNHAMLEQAENSLSQEVDCHQFDVCRNPDNPQEFFLYELYTDHAAFDVHLASEHFIAFDQCVSAWIENKEVRLLQRL
ncbi:putative quinol monooxygenase [Terasakiella sp. SH-1]|uniref:putative quinol monooxygenase n=1 Tax=Terasakiella sp. SH-1 TaxID=2560057 RepID=UPI00107409CD|nr:putative quinol monooxygenase [Terasakiella sp. SH-1]